MKAISAWRNFSRRLTVVFLAASCARPVAREAVSAAEKATFNVPAMKNRNAAAAEEEQPLDPVCYAPFPPAPSGDREVPAYRLGILSRETGEAEWHAFHESLHRDPHSTHFGAAELFAYPHIFAAEGGMQKTPGGSAIGGIMNDTLRRLRRDGNPDSVVQALKKDCAHLKTTRGVTPELLTRLYAYYFDSALRGLPEGRKAFDAVGSPYAAAAMGDTLFRFGERGGAELMRDAVNAAGNGHPGFAPVGTEDDLLGPGIFSTYSAFARDPATLPSLLGHLAAARIAKTDADAPRITRKPWLDRNRRKIANYRAGEKARSIFFAYVPEMHVVGQAWRGRKEKNCPPVSGLRGP